MLQIISGKFFTSEDYYVTRQRAVLYSNYRTSRDLETAVGSLRVAERWRELATLIYEVDQRLERSPSQGFGLVAVAPDTLINDFAAVASFTLRITCTPDVELARRLTQSQHAAVGVARPAAQMVPRIFDAQVLATAEDAAVLADAITQLIGLPRAIYEPVLRAIRRYVTGLHRLGDDVDLSYALLVASIESLAQEFDQFSPAWMDVPDDKRQRMDSALAGVSDPAAAKVRAAYLAGEHLALGRRYREFVLAHLDPAFFRGEAQHVAGPVRRIDLRRALEQAYRLRSTYVHTLRPLPSVLTAMGSETEAITLEGTSLLTVAGLARLARAVIRTFMARAPQIAQESFDWRGALPGIVHMSVAPQHWVFRADWYSADTARVFLQGFIDELSAQEAAHDAALTDIREVLARIEVLAPSVAPKTRRPMVALYVLYHHVMAAEYHRPGGLERAKVWEEELTERSLESLAIHTIVDAVFPWPADVLEALWEEYVSQRHHKRGLRLPAIYEVAIRLRLAELAWTSGDRRGSLARVQHAVEDYPGHAPLLALENQLSRLTAGSADGVVNAATSPLAATNGPAPSTVRPAAPTIAPVGTADERTAGDADAPEAMSAVRDGAAITSDVPVFAWRVLLRPHSAAGAGGDRSGGTPADPEDT